MDRKTTGFTLLETLVAMAVVAIIVSVALPAYLGAMSTTRITGLQTTLIEHLTLAIRHAVVTGAPVVVCISHDSEQCVEGSTWSAGWIVFADTDRDRHRGPNDPVVHRQARLKHDLRMTGATSRSKLVFLANGSAPGSNTTFTLCDASRGNKGRVVMLANNGRLRKDSATPEATAACQASVF